MKKSAYILLTFLLASTIWSCRSIKSISETNSTTTKTETQEIKTDSVAKIETSKPIKDEIIINVPKSDNEAVNKAIDALLQQLNTSKTSGSNSYTSRYDAENQRLLINFLIGQTQNKQTDVKNNTNTETNFEQQTDTYIYKKLKQIPIWFYVFVIFWFLPQIIDRLKLIISPFSTLLKK